MIDSPSEISPEQFKELGIQLKTEIAIDDL